LYKGLTKNKRANDLKKAEAVVKIIEQIKIDEKSDKK
jgi:hypothetical protein